MSQPTAGKAGATGKKRAGAGFRALVPGLAFFAAGVALSALWFLRAPSHTSADPANSGPPPLSDATKAVLQRLGAPVEIRFYSLLDPASVGDSGREFSGRVDQLLSQYEQEGAGKIKVARVNLNSSAAANAAVADGIKPFNMDKGDACYLGIAVVRGGQKATLASLAPEWEAALESDLSRAIAGVDATGPHAQPARKPDVATLEAVKHTIPNLDTVTVEEGSRQLKTAALAKYKKTAQETQTRVEQAQERLLQAQNSGSASDQQAALKDLQQAKKEQTDKLKEIALASKAQQEALQQLKGPAH
ncbi:MAG: Gldg family protein [Verrucomicrobiota bacterium]|jgi:hypothetical protein